MLRLAPGPTVHAPRSGVLGGIAGLFINRVEDYFGRNREQIGMKLYGGKKSALTDLFCLERGL